MDQNTKTLTNPTPKQQFQADSIRIGQHRNMVDTESFIEGANFAMLEYQRLLAMRDESQYNAMAAGIKMQGALEFLQQFRMLAETAPQASTKAIVPSLNHRV